MELNSFYSLPLWQSSLTVMVPPMFDTQEIAGEYKESLMERFCRGEVSSATVAHLFNTAPILKES